MKNIKKFYLKIFLFFCGKIFNIFEEACFRNVRKKMTNKRHMKRRRTKQYNPCLKKKKKKKKKKADINMTLIAENLLPFAFRIFSFFRRKAKPF